MFYIVDRVVMAPLLLNAKHVNNSYFNRIKLSARFQHNMIIFIFRTKSNDLI